LRESEAVQQVLASDVIELPRPDAPKVPVPSRPFFGRTDERQRLQAWLAAETPSVAVLVGVAGIGKTALITRLLADEPRPTFMRRVYAHDDAHGLLSSFADFLARQGRRRLKSVITRPAYDPTEAVAVMRGDLSGCVVAIDDLHATPARSRRNDTSSRRSWTALTIRRRNCCGRSRSCDAQPGPQRPSVRPCPSSAASFAGPYSITGMTGT